MDIFELSAKITADSSELEGALGKAKDIALGVFSGIAKASMAAFAAGTAAITSLVGKAVEGYASYEQLIGGVQTLFGAQGKSLEEFAADQGKTVDEVKEQWMSLVQAQGTVGRNANMAFKTAGLSANEYLETVTSFSASLIASVDGDTVKAAELADRAIIDMSDNANKMGSSMESIQNAYNGFAKQNYTMLDNLKLGYGGTKEEMQRLLDDAEKLPAAMGQKFDISNYADVVTAIGLIQDEMGITGTTAKEAASTIEGSVGMMKAAWANLAEGLANEDADMIEQIDFFVESVSIAADNILPRVEMALANIGELITTMAPIIAEKLPAFITEALPPMIEAITVLVASIAETLPGLIQALLPTIVNSIVTIVQSLVSVLPGLISTLLPAIMEAVLAISQAIIEMLPEIFDAFFAVIEESGPALMEQALIIIEMLTETLLGALPQLIEIGMQMLAQLLIGIAEALPTMIPTITEIIIQCVNTLIANLPLLLDAALQLMQGLAQGFLAALPTIIAALPQIISGILDFLIGAIPQLIQAGIDLFIALVQALPQIIEAIVAAIPQIIDAVIAAIIEAIPLLIQAGIQLFVALIEALPDIIVAIVEAIPQIIDSVINALIESIPLLIQAGIDLFVAIISDLPTIILKLVEAIPKIITALVDGFLSFVESFGEIGKNLIDGLWEGIKKAWDTLVDSVMNLASDLWSGLCDFFGIHSPSRKFMEMGKYMVQGLGIGWDEEYKEVKKDIMSDLDFSAVPFNVNADVNGEFNGNGSGQVVNNMTINVNKEIATADEIAELIRIESRYGLMGGTSLA